LRKHVLGQLIRLVPDGFWYKSLSHKLKWIHQMSFEEGGRRHARALSYFYFTEEFREKMYGSRLKENLSGFDPEESIYRFFDSQNASELLDKMLLADSLVRLPDHSVMITDRTTMAHGLETRAPFLDPDLVDFSLSLSSNLKVKDGKTKILFKHALSRFWPPELRTRGKQGFAAPYQSWLGFSDVNALANRVFANGSRLRQLLPGLSDRQQQQRDYQTWNLLTLGLWLERHEFALT